MGKIHLDIRKLSKMQQLIPVYKHNLRLMQEEHLEHLDHTRTYLNHDLVNPGNVEYMTLVRDRIHAVSTQVGYNIRKRKDAIIAYEIVLAYSHGAEAENGFAVEDWEQASLRWLQEYFGVENVVSAMVHLDESSPHIHAVVVPITPDNRLCAKDFTGGRAKMSLLHQSYGKEMAKAPFHLELPQKFNGRGYHEGIKAFYRQINEIEDYTLPEKEQEEELDAYLTRLTDYVKKRDRRHLSDVKYLRLKLEQAYASFREVWITYKQAINLYQFLERKLGSPENANQELLNLYELEHVPRQLLQEYLDNFRQSYQMDGYFTVEKDAFSMKPDNVNRKNENNGIH